MARQSKGKRRPSDAAERLLDDAALCTALRRELAAGADTVLWQQQGDRVLVHLDTLSVRTGPHGVQVSIELQTDQSGRSPLTIGFALAGPDDPADLTAVTEHLPAGDPVLAARWGQPVQEAVFEALLRVLDRAAEAAGRVPVGLRAGTAGLELVTGETAS
ncbi:MAG TPA: hypothetical protein VFU36_04495 [Jatrophihabitans sp.]|nr:hypothetical protein [Jatrophihabitans sp.]